MKILMISNHLGVQSGVQRYVQNLLLHLDTAKYRVTLFVGQCPPDQASTAPALEAHGVEILAVPDNKKDRIRALAAHLRTHKDYDIIHYHTASKIGAPVCGMMRVLCPRAKIVVHSHIVYPPMTLTWRAAHLVYQLFADYFLGCGVAAGRFVFGDHIDAKPNFSVACNAVDAGRFHPDAAARAATRAAWGITDTDRLAGFVGRLNHQKNPLFLMEVFAAMAAQDPHWKLLLVGTGEMEPEMHTAAARRGLTDRVIFAGVQSDVPAFMNAFDLFLLPSNFEGSPVTLVEAQGCGVPCLASTNVPDDGSVTDLVHFLPLAAPLTDWAAKAEAIAAHGDHDDHWAALSAAGYELKTAARRMEQLYDKLGGPRMIYAELAGGLGNQMFIYAFARALGLRCGEPVTLLDRQDWRDGAPAHTVCALDALNISPDVKIIADAGFTKAHLPRRNAAKALMIKYEQRRGLMARDWHSFEAAAAPLLNAVGLHFATDGYTPARRGHARDFLAWGYFQSERYFADFAPIIKEELRAKAAPAGPYAAQITAAAYPVCVHLRRGDYQKPENAILQVCTPDYYARAVAAVRDEHPDAALFVFSDDIDWAREHLDTAGLPAVFLPRGEAVADLALMQLCRGFVLSNSTYSWWAQYLAPAPDKQTWAPDKWYAHTKKTALYQEGWQLVSTK